MRFVPYVGAVASAVFPLTLAAAVDPGWTMVVETAAFFLFLEGMTGQVVEPLVYGHRHRPVPGVGRDLRHLLDLAVGTGRADPVHAACPCAWSSWAATSSGWSS